MAARGQTDMPNPQESGHKASENLNNTSPINGEGENKSRFKRTQDEDYGYYFYPEREHGEKESKHKTFWQNVWTGRKTGHHMNCEVNVVWCVEKNPMVKLMMRALKSHGCEVNLRRHIACEPCRSNVNGGFDPTSNQVVICENNARRRSICCNVLAHEFLHAFDSCRAKVDFENLKHLACTEIRAANIMHCSFLAAWAAQEVSFTNFKQKHAECVKSKAVMSIVMVRNIPTQQARDIVDSVFDKCYRDLEPVGRIPRRGSRDSQRALLEGEFYGYSDE